MSGNFAWMSWEAFASLVTGVAAVAAAYTVGRRQADIQARQVDLQNRQTEILQSQLVVEQLRLRRELFDDRLKVYDSVRRWLTDTITAKSTPERGSEVDLAISEAIDRSRFLFRSEVHPALLGIRRLGERLDTAKAEFKKPLFVSIVPGGPDFRQMRVDEILHEFRKAHDSLSEIFSDELRLRDS